MSKSSVALVAGRVRRNSSGKASNRLFGGAAIACIVIGAGWTVYNNIIAASVYPTLGTASYDEPVCRPKVASRSTSQIISDAFAALPEPAPAIAKPETVAAISQDMFNERFAASAPASVASNAVNAEPPAAPKLAEALKESSKSAVATKVAEAKPADPKAADAAKSKTAPVP